MLSLRPFRSFNVSQTRRWSQIFAVLTEERAIGSRKTRHSNACWHGSDCRDDARNDLSLTAVSYRPADITATDDASNHSRCLLRSRHHDIIQHLSYTFGRLAHRNCLQSCGFYNHWLLLARFPPSNQRTQRAQHRLLLLSLLTV